MAEHDDVELESYEVPPQVLATRRAILQAAIGAGVTATVLSALYVAAGLKPKEVLTPNKEPPKPGDILVWAQGSNANQPLQGSDLKEGGPFILVYPMDPVTKVVKNGIVNNTMMVLKLPTSKMGPKTASMAYHGIVAYSAWCTHLGCIVSIWRADLQDMQCPCHGTIYNPYHHAEVVSGPAPRPLPGIKVKESGGNLVIDGHFDGPLGPDAIQWG